MKAKMLVVLVLAASSAFAETRFFFGIGSGGNGPQYYGPPPVYYSAPPAYAYAAPCPGPGYIWAPGSWYYDGPRRYWRDGYWSRPVYRPYFAPRYGYNSYAPRYNRERREERHEREYWRR